LSILTTLYLFLSFFSIVMIVYNSFAVVLIILIYIALILSEVTLVFVVLITNNILNKLDTILHWWYRILNNYLSTKSYRKYCLDNAMNKKKTKDLREYRFWICFRLELSESLVLVRVYSLLAIWFSPAQTIIFVKKVISQLLKNKL
jgi:hypothetical protein